MDSPALEIDRTVAIPGWPLIAVSSGKLISCSTSSGAMPPASVMIVTVGLLRSGKTSTGRRVACRPPQTISTTAATSTNSRLPRLFSSNHWNMAGPLANLGDQAGALHHHPLASLQAAGDQHPQAVQRLAADRPRRKT